MVPEYEVFAVRFASAERNARDNFLFQGERDGIMPLDFYFWVIRHGQMVVVVDTGFSEASGLKRKRQHACSPARALKELDIDPSAVQHLVLTHLHYDHTGNCGLFGNATIHVQRAEVEYATGPNMRHLALQHFFEPADVQWLVGAVYARRVEFHEGDGDILPGLSVHLLGGHTDGLQVVRVWTRRGWVVLASDAAHYFANLRDRNPFPAITNLPRMLDGYDRLLRLADSPAHVVPGHDPEVRRMYPLITNGSVEIACLHESQRRGAEEGTP